MLLSGDNRHDITQLLPLLDAIPAVRSRVGRPRHGFGLGTYRWDVERIFAWLHAFRRLHICRDRLADMHEALRKLGCRLITHRQLGSPCWPLSHRLRQ